MPANSRWDLIRGFKTFNESRPTIFITVIFHPLLIALLYALLALVYIYCSYERTVAKLINWKYTAPAQINGCSYFVEYLCKKKYIYISIAGCRA